MSSYFDFSNQEKQLESCKIRTYAKTALHSCVVPQILTCSLRSSERKDIVFAKETVLELLEITREGTLVSIFEQPVFGTIKDIKVLHCRFSEPVYYDPLEEIEENNNDFKESNNNENNNENDNNNNNNNDNDNGKESNNNNNDNSNNHDNNDDDDNNNNNNNDNNKKKKYYTKSEYDLNKDLINQENLRVIPGHDVLVCLSDSGILSFIAYTESAFLQQQQQQQSNKGKGKYFDNNNLSNNLSCNNNNNNNSSNLDIARKSGKFLSIKEIKLSEPGFDYKDIGRLVCIDPMGRYIAVAAWQNLFQLFSLAHDSIFDFDATEHTNKYLIDGNIILHMTFLYPQDESSILLALVVFDENSKRTSILLYNLVASEKPEDRIKATQIILDKHEFFPTQFIPLPNFPECCLLVNEHEVCFVRGKNGELKNITYRVVLPVSQSLMTSFAYPMDESVLKRTAALPLSPKQYVYAGMETGYLYRIDIISEKSIVFTLLQDENFINPIGTGMTVLCLDPEIGDFIIFSGEMSDGAVVMSGPKSKSKITWEIPNWAPISDFQMLDLHKERRDVIFSCSGVAPYGSIRELRKAVGVNVITRAESDFNGINSLWNLKYNVNDTIDTFLALSFANSTRLMRVSKCELDDVSDQSGFDLEVSSILIASLVTSSSSSSSSSSYSPSPSYSYSYSLSNSPSSSRIGGGASHIGEVEKDYESNSGYLIQIHRKSIIVSKPNIISESYIPITQITKFRWIPPDNSIIEVADVYDSIVIISLSTINGSILYVLQLLIDPSSIHNKVSFSILAEVPLDSQPCFIRCLSPSPHAPVPICIIGTYNPSLKFFLLNQPENCLELVHEEFLDDISATKVNIPESVLIIGDNEKAYFLAGLREGTITFYEWIWSTVENKPLLSRPQCRRIGTYPVKFIIPNKNQSLIICNVNDSASILALSDRPWQIKYSHRTGLDFICVAFKHYEHVQEAVYFRYANLTQTYMFVSNDCLNFVKLNDFIKNNMRTIIVYDTPRRLFYDDLNNLLLVACVSSSEPFPTSVLKLVDPINGVIFDEYFLRSEENYEHDIREAVYSISEWRFTNERQDFRCICIGTGYHRGVENAVRPTPPHRGRLLIFIIKKSLNDYGLSRIRYQLKLITSTEVDDPVHSICPLNNEYLLVGAANTLNLLHFNLEKKKLSLIYNKSHRWPILSVSACGTRISVGATHGFYFYEFDVNKERFRFLKSERTSRLINDTMMLNENLAVGCDKDGDVYGLMYDKGDSSIEPVLKQVFSFHVAEIISRLRVGYLDYRSDSFNNNYNNYNNPSGNSVSNSNIDDSNNTTNDDNDDNNNNNGNSNISSSSNKKNDDNNNNGWDVDSEITRPAAAIVGCSLLGSVFLFMRIGIKTYDLLLVLQSILEKWPTTRPCLGNDNKNFRKNHRRQSLNLVIDGEMVSQFLRLTRTEQFKIVNNNPKLINAGTIFLRGEQIESEESRINQQQQITADHLEYRGSGGNLDDIGNIDDNIIDNIDSIDEIMYDDEITTKAKTAITSTTIITLQDDEPEMYMEEDLEEEEEGEEISTRTTLNNNKSINREKGFLKLPELLDFPEEEEEIIRNKIIEKNLVSTEEIVGAIQSVLLELNMHVS
ncbi:hypothetical protein Glove_21g356 [Diversispora epigaea]|uniref:Cleavage/polyadenylation specificity factor A subunit N-terminal domain-containing protein n=1 Tax=Diversispora epigaea TaxID=1348612 RepID=A0A397JS09_9GLOM|nr:hypothetical protein Glove_21g356 [Diversispora epigaea]